MGAKICIVWYAIFQQNMGIIRNHSEPFGIIWTLVDQTHRDVERILSYFIPVSLPAILLRKATTKVTKEQNEAQASASLLIS